MVLVRSAKERLEVSDVGVARTGRMSEGQLLWTAVIRFRFRKCKTKQTTGQPARLRRARVKDDVVDVMLPRAQTALRKELHSKYSTPMVGGGLRTRKRRYRRRSPACRRV